MNKKDTIYIDPEDDITGIIDRVNTAKSPIVAAVLPKRAQVLHSSVNMRLLKRAADSKKKRLVLITTEAAVLKMAASVRVHVAKSLTSKPVLPVAPAAEDLETIVSDTSDDAPIDSKKSVGELAGDKPKIEQSASVTSAAVDHEETIELDNVSEEELLKTETAVQPKKNRKLKVPNFDKFRTRLFLGIAAGLLVLIGLFLAIFVLPKADIVIKTETNSLETKFDFTANTAAQTVDEATKTLPAQLKEVKQTITEKFQATGTVDKGNKAKGFVSLKNCNANDETVNLPANTRVQVGDSLFRTDAPAVLPANTTASGLCLSPSVNIDVTSELAGDKYNLSARGGYSTPDYADITGSGGNMTGGTSNPVKAISEADVDAAKQKILLRNTEKDKEAVTNLLKDASQFPLAETFTSTPADAVVSPGINQEGTEGTVTIIITYQMLGVAEKDMDDLLRKDQEARINTATQKIYNNGLTSAKAGQLERKSPGESKLVLTTSATVGPLLDTDAIARDIAGKNGGETKKSIESRPGITGTEVRYSPFWVLKTPKKLNRINITFDGNGEVR